MRTWHAQIPVHYRCLPNGKPVGDPDAAPLELESNVTFTPSAGLHAWRRACLRRPLDMGDEKATVPIKAQ
jgi:hypothetical protein